jgi:hypothetical protein
MPDCQLFKTFFNYKCNLLRIVISNILDNPKGILMFLKLSGDTLFTILNAANAVFLQFSYCNRNFLRDFTSIKILFLNVPIKRNNFILILHQKQPLFTSLNHSNRFITTTMYHLVPLNQQ